MRECHSKTIFFAIFLAPAFLLFTIFIAIPGLRALGYSLHRWNGITAPEWIGFENFARLFRKSDLFLAALANNLTLLSLSGVVIIVLSLSFAAILHRRTRGASIFRVAFFFPNIIPSVAVALLWVLLYSTTEFGVFNALLALFTRFFHALGLTWPDPELPVAFLESRNLIFAVVPMVVWTATGFYMVLFLAAMGGIPETYYEAAKLDGASGFAQFRYITLPLIREVLVVGLVFLLITTLKFFDPIWIMENQRPTMDSHMLATLLYQKAFTEYDIGYGAAVAVLLFLLIFMATLLTFHVSRADRIEY